MSNTLRSLMDSVTAAGAVYGWRIDAVLLTGALWLAASTVRKLATSVA